MPAASAPASAAAVAARPASARLEPLRRKTAPFAGELAADAARGVLWVRRELVAEVEFRAWTADGLLRHATFRGLREDKPAREVVREARGAAPKPAPRRGRLTHPDRVYWPDVGVTKQGLADYYAEVWPRMAPHRGQPAAGAAALPRRHRRPVLLPEARLEGPGREILTFDDPEDDGDAPLVAVDGLPGLIGLVQGGALEIHAWQSTLDDLEHPDQIVMDLDPGEGDRLGRRSSPPRARCGSGCRRAGLAAFVKTSGGKGLHVVAPLQARRRLGRGQGLRRRDGAGDGRRRSRPLRRHRRQGQARAAAS